MVKYWIVIALCASLAFATNPHFPQNPGNNEDWKHNSHGSQSTHNSVEWPSHGYNHQQPQYNSGHWPGLDFHNSYSPLSQGNWPYHGSHNPHSSQNFGKWPQYYSHHSGGWPYHGFHNQPSMPNYGERPNHGSFNPQSSGPNQERINQDQPNLGNWPKIFPSLRSLRSSEEKGNHGFHKPQSQNFNDLKNFEFPKPNFPHNFGGFEHHDFPKTPSFYNSPEWNNPIPNVPPTPMFGNQNWGNKVNRPDWFNPHFPQRAQHVNNVMDDISRRRPLFYPVYPYHFYHPYHHPSTNDEEFQTIEARRQDSQESDEDSNEGSDQQKSGHSHNHGHHHHGHHDHHWPENSDNSEIPFVHPHFPHFNPFHKNQGGNEEFYPGDAQSYEVLSVNDDHFPFIIIGDHEYFHISDILKIIKQWLDDLKSHLPPHIKPDEDSLEDIEGSGEEEIISMVSGVDAPLSQDLVTED